MNNTLKTLGVFDSGIGGLTVYKSLRQFCPKADIIYLGDTARLPYGTKSADTIKRYLEQNVAFLSKRGVDAIVVACNSASTVLGITNFEIPVEGVIVPGSQMAIAATKSGKIGVLATKATVAAMSYTKTIQVLNSDIQVIEQACPLLVPLVEEGMLHDSITAQMIARYTDNLLQAGVDTLILGCTHYPILKDVIGSVVGKEIVLVDSADCIGQKFSKLHFTGTGQGSFLLSDVSSSFITMANFILGKDFTQIERIDI